MTMQRDPGEDDDSPLPWPVSEIDKPKQAPTPQPSLEETRTDGNRNVRRKGAPSR
jgi:hypothetical protein